MKVSRKQQKKTIKRMAWTIEGKTAVIAVLQMDIFQLQDALKKPPKWSMSDQSPASDGWYVTEEKGLVFFRQRKDGEWPMGTSPAAKWIGPISMPEQHA